MSEDHDPERRACELCEWFLPFRATMEITHEIKLNGWPGQCVVRAPDAAHRWPIINGHDFCSGFQRRTPLAQEAG